MTTTLFQNSVALPSTYLNIEFDAGWTLKFGFVRTTRSFAGVHVWSCSFFDGGRIFHVLVSYAKPFTCFEKVNFAKNGLKEVFLTSRLYHVN